MPSNQYFQNFPLRYYPFGDGQFKLVTDILRRVKFVGEAQRNGNAYIDYTIKEGDTPENIAARFYGSSNLHWIVLLFNEIVDPYYGWPLENETLEKFIDNKYGSDKNDPKQFELEDGTIVQPPQAVLTQQGIPIILNQGPLQGQTVLLYNESNGTEFTEPIIEISNRQYEIRRNESRRSIKLLRPEYVDQVVGQIQQKIR